MKHKECIQTKIGYQINKLENMQILFGKRIIEIEKIDYVFAYQFR